MVRLIADTVLVGILLFTSAETFAWARAWVLLGILFLVRAIGALAVYRVNPELLRERARLPIHNEQSLADRALLLGVLAAVGHAALASAIQRRRCSTRSWPARRIAV